MQDTGMSPKKPETARYFYDRTQSVFKSLEFNRPYKKLRATIVLEY